MICHFPLRLSHVSVHTKHRRSCLESGRTATLDSEPYTTATLSPKNLTSESSRRQSLWNFAGSYIGTSAGQSDKPNAARPAFTRAQLFLIQQFFRPRSFERIVRRLPLRRNIVPITR